MKLKWRRLLRVVHRDMGYTVAALSIAYAISGVAVNHQADWNANYAFDEVPVAVGALPVGEYQKMQDQVVAELGLDSERVKGHHMQSDTEFRVFLEGGGEVQIDVRDGKGLMKRVSTRTFLYEVNVLHLNSLKGLWTWIADLFALCILILAITGIIFLRGKQGIMGRGKYFVVAGLAIPVGFILHMYYGS